MLANLGMLAKIAGGKFSTKQTDNANSVLAGLARFDEDVGLDQPHRLAQYLAQIMHESGRFVYDREAWGPTPAQLKYEGRTDLGNTQPGDGSKFRGYTAMQITGRANTTKFYNWCKERFKDVPNFVNTPALMNTDPWEGIGPIWFWVANNLNRYADKGDVEMVSRTVNGGTNGLSDRLALYSRAALVMLGYELNAGVIGRFQATAGLHVDDQDGPLTRMALHKALVALSATPVIPATPVTPSPSPTKRTHSAIAADMRTLADELANLGD